ADVPGLLAAVPHQRRQHQRRDAGVARLVPRLGTVLLGLRLPVPAGGLLEAAVRPPHAGGPRACRGDRRHAPRQPAGGTGARHVTIALFLGTLLGAMALGVPIAFALLACGAALMWHMDMFDAQILAQNVLEGANSFPLLAVPFFMLAGEIMNAGGLSRRIVHFAMTLVGHVRGGLGYVAIMAAILMAALSGSAVADAAALAALLLPMMNRAGYDKARSAGLLASASVIAPV